MSRGQGLRTANPAVSRAGRLATTHASTFCVTTPSTATTTVVVAIVAASDIVASGLRAILSTDPTMCVLDHSLRSGLGADVVLYDMAGLETADGTELLRLAKLSGSALVLVGRDRRHALLSRTMSVGVDGILSIDAEAHDVLSMVHATARGEQVLASAGSGHLGFDVGLTPREVQVLAHIVRGLSNAQIAENLALSPNSIKSYIRSAYRKIDVESRTQAVSWCFRHGFEL